MIGQQFGRKITRLIVISTGLALVLASAAFVIYDRATLRAGIVRGAVTAANYIANNCTAALSFGDRQTADETLSILRNEPRVILACVYDAKGRPFAVYSPDGQAPPGPAPSGEWERFEGETLDVCRRVTLEGETVGAVRIRRDLADLGERLRYDAGVAGVTLAAAFLVAVATGTRLQRLAMAPIGELVRTVDAVARSGDYSLRARRVSRDELGYLTEQVNAMLAEIQKRDADVQKAQAELEDRVSHRTLELRERSLELERFARLAVGRERRMIVLKRRINDLSAELGRPPPYALSFLGTEEQDAEKADTDTRRTRQE